MKLSNLFFKVLRDETPVAAAKIGGNSSYPNLSGMVEFYQIPLRGALVSAEISGLPVGNWDEQRGFFAMHIHEVGDCALPFDKVGRTIILRMSRILIIPGICCHC